MSFSLQSRDVIADSIETVMGGQWYDANIAIPGCDKNMPGCLIAMGRVNRPAIMVRLAALVVVVVGGRRQDMYNTPVVRNMLGVVALAKVMVLLV